MTDPTNPDQAPQPPQPQPPQPQVPQPQVPWQPATSPGASQPPPGWPPPPQPPTSWTGPAQEAGPAPGIRFASHGPRLVAYILDTILITVVLIVVITVLSIGMFGSAWLTGLRSSDFGDGTVSPAAIGAIVGFTFLVLFLGLLSFAYFPFFWARSGQTPGMRPFGLYVVRDTDGGKITGGQAILRLFGYWVSAVVFYLGFIWIFIDARRRGWHDLIAGTVVIERSGPG